MPERPIECTECTRPITVEYKEIVEGKTIELSMCGVCPVCQRLVHGTTEPAKSDEESRETGLACGHCDTTLEEIRTGNPMGCPHCYEVFADVVAYELANEKRLAQQTHPKKGTPLHMGRAPGETIEINPAIQLVALDEALEETLKSEDYEGAAWLRDKIAKLKGKVDEGDQG